MIRYQLERGEPLEAQPLADLGLRICDIRDTQDDHTQGLQTSKCRSALCACKLVIAQITGDYKTVFYYSQLRFAASEDLYKITGMRIGFDTSTHSTLGIGYAMNHVYDQAIIYLNKSVDLQKNMPDFKPDWLFSPYYHLGITYHCQKKYKEAVAILRQAITDREEALGPNDRLSCRTGALYYVLGNVCNSQGRYDEAYAYHHRALIQCCQTAGESALASLRVAQKVAEHHERYGYDDTAR